MVWSSTAFKKNPVDIDHELCKKCFAENGIAKLCITQGMFNFRQKILKLFLENRVQANEIEASVIGFLKAGVEFRG